MNETRNTIQKSLVKKAVTELKTHPTADELYEYIRRDYPTISRATVYRNLGQLADNGEILKIPVPNKSDHYDFNIKPHFHFVCDDCGKTVDVDFLPKQVDVSDLTAKGYFVTGYEMIFNGLCPECKIERDNK